MRTVLFIPARHASRRFPGKPLHPIRGATGEARSLLRRSWDAARRVGGIERLAVLTDDVRIVDEVERFGGEVAMSSPACRNGTERCAEAVAALADPPDLVINLQCDAPLTPPHVIEALVEAMDEASGANVATPLLRLGGDAAAALRIARQGGRAGVTTAVLGQNDDALYFSREVLPAGDGPVFHHVGVYAYRPAALGRYTKLSPGPLEMREGLEQLRFLENGIPVRGVEVDMRGDAFHEVNHPEDIAMVEAILKREGRA